MAGIIGAHMLATNPASLICELPVWAAAGWYGCRAVGSSSWKVHQNTSDLLPRPTLGEDELPPSDHQTSQTERVSHDWMVKH